MSPYDDGEQGGSGRTATAVLLAVAVLAVIGSLFGYLLGTRANDAKASANPTTNSTGTTGTRTATGGTGQTKSPAATQCPEFMQQAASAKGATRPLTLRLYIATQKSEVWICAAADGKLWYQGHSIRKSRFPDEVPVEGENGLLLSQVNALNDGAYLAINEDSNGRTDYRVSPQELTIERRGGNKTTEKVVDTSP
jgi:hypothetical protein